MAELNFGKDRRFLATDLGEAVLVVPDAAVGLAALLEVQEAVKVACGTAANIVAQGDFSSDLFARHHVIACGHMANNAALQRLYTRRSVFVDTFFPGPGGYFVKTVSDPFGHGKNCIVVGASSLGDLPDALEVFAAVARDSDGSLARVHAHRFDHSLPEPPDISQLGDMVQRQLDIWGGGWSASPFRGGQLLNYMWHYYLTDHQVWGRAVAPIFAGSIAPWRAERAASPESYHCFFNLHSYIHLWDLIEDSPLYSATDRRGVVAMFGELLHHLAGLHYLRPDVNRPGEPRQNHSTFVGLNLAVGHDYMAGRYGIEDFAAAQEAVERIFAGQASTYKPNDDAGVGYAWHVPQESLYYYLYKDDYAYIDAGHVADLCRLAGVTIDNMRSEGSYGDTSGYSAFNPSGWNGHLWPLLVSTWRKRDPRHLWLLNWLGEGKTPSLSQVLSGLYAGVDFDGGFRLAAVEPAVPDELLGICAIDLPQPALDWVAARVPAAHQPDGVRRYYDKLSLRRNFDPEDEYLLLEGVGTFCHGHEDTNAIIRLTWKNRAWLADGDYIRAAPKFHNSITVQRDGLGVLEPPGEGVVIPPLGALRTWGDSPFFGLLQSEAQGYNGLDWRRNIFWRKGRYFAVVDQLHCRRGGSYRCTCHWRLVGEPTLDDNGVRLEQQGVDFYLRHGEDTGGEIVADSYAAGQWNGYPYAEPSPQVLYQRQSAELQEGEDLFFFNVLTPCADLRVERLAAGAIRTDDGTEQTVLGLGSICLGDIEIEGTLFALCCNGETVELQGVERIGLSGDWKDLGGACHTFALGDSELAPRLKDAVAAAIPLPAKTAPAPPQRRTGGLQIGWDLSLDSEINAVAVHGEDCLVATAAGHLAQLATLDGERGWQREMDVPATAVLLAPLDGGLAAIAGTAASELVVFGADGTERWRRPLVNISARGEQVAALAVADLEGTGSLNLLAGTAGWYVNAFAADGRPLWNNWIRYHVITRLCAVDADGDGKAEVLVGNIYSTPLSVHNSDGTFRWSTLEQVGSEGNATTPRRGIYLTQMQVADLDGDGVAEIVYGTADGWIYVVDPRDGAESWRANIVGEVVGLEVLSGGVAAAGEYGDLYLFAYDGQLLWHVHGAAWLRRLVAVGDCLLAAADGGALLCFDLEGQCISSLNLPEEIRDLHSLPKGVLCNLDGGRLCRVDLADK